MPVQSSEAFVNAECASLAQLNTGFGGWSNRSLNSFSAPSGTDRGCWTRRRVVSDHPAKPCEARRWMSAGGFAVLGSANTRRSSGTTRSTRTCCRG